MSERNTSGSGQQPGSSNPASSSSTSSSSLMAKFYQPMNAPFVPATPTPPPPVPQHQQTSMPMVTLLGNQGLAPTQSQGIGASAAQLLANLATTPGYISDEAILEYSRQQQQQKLQQPHQQQPYHHQQQQQHTSQWQLPFSQQGSSSNQTQPQPYFAPTQYQPPQSQVHPQGFPHVQPSIQQPHDYSIPSDPNAAIGALLKELQQTGGAPPSSASIPPPKPQLPVPQRGVQPQSQPSQAGFGYQPTSASSSVQQPLQEEMADDFSSGKITPQLLKKLAALAELDGQNGSSLLNEIKRLRSRQTRTELSLYEDREELLNKHKRDLVKLQASGIMGVNVESDMQRTKSTHYEELKRFDQRVVRAMDKEITLVQESLKQAGVPLMSSTQDPGKIATQIRVLRLLEDMLQT